MSLFTVAIFAVFAMSLALFVVWSNFFRKLYRDIYRQDLFLIRDELFNKAARGEIPFEDPAYHALRYVINGNIRWAHKLSAGSIFLMWVFRKKLQIEKFADPRLELASESYPEVYQFVTNSIATRTILFCVKTSLFLRVSFRILKWLSERERFLERAANEVEPMVDEFGVAGAKRAGIAF